MTNEELYIAEKTPITKLTKEDLQVLSNSQFQTTIRCSLNNGAYPVSEYRAHLMNSFVHAFTEISRNTDKLGEKWIITSPEVAHILEYNDGKNYTFLQRSLINFNSYLNGDIRLYSTHLLKRGETIIGFFNEDRSVNTDLKYMASVRVDF